MRRETNDVTDIEGAAPAKRFGRWEKPDLFTTRDIEGARPKKLHVKRVNKPDSSATSDIDDAKPRIKVFRTKRVVDPLDPVYDLPQAQLAPMAKPRFLRDAMDVSDLPGARPKTYEGRRQPRDPLATADIPGATQATSFLAYKSLQRREIPRYALDVQDIVSKRKRTNRVTNPLKPVYFMNDLRIQDSARARPRTSAGILRKGSEVDRAMRTDDIPGAQVGSALDKVWLQRDTIEKEDIAGSHADTLQRGLVTKRIPTNPLQPTYRGLGGETVRCSTAPATRARRPAPDVVASKPVEAELRRPSTQEGLSSMLASVFAVPRPATASASTSASSSLRSSSGRQESRAALLTQSTSQMIPVDMSDAAVTISLQRKVVVKDVRVEDDGAFRLQQAQARSKIRAATPRMRPVMSLTKSGASAAAKRGAGAGRTQATVQQDRMAVANLPDTLSASSCLFPNRTRTRKQHQQHH